MSRVQLRFTLPLPSDNLDFTDEQLNYLKKLVTILVENFRALGEADASGWQPENTPTSGNRDIDADAATLDETRKSLARLIEDLKTAGVLSQ